MKESKRTKIILVRHGQSMANNKHTFAGHMDKDLSQIGHAQAVKTAEYLVKNYQIDAIYSSDLIRAYNTAQHIADKYEMKVVTEPKLREIYAAKWQGLVFDDILRLYPEDYRLWLDDVGNACCTDGESVKELSARIFCAVEKIVKKNIGKTVLIVTHATPIRALQCIWNGMTLNEMKNIPWVPNSSITVADYESGNYEIKVCAEDCYLKGMKSGFPTNV